MGTTKCLEGLPVMLSASVPDELRGSPRALDLFSAVTLLVRRIIAAGGRVVFGGHPSIVPLVRRAALEAGADEGTVQLYLLNCFRNQAPPEINDRQVFGSIHWLGNEDDTKPSAADLSALRDAMVKASQAAVFIGGRTAGYYGDLPGIRDEYQRFLGEHEQGPVYLLGLLDGETSRIISELEANRQREKNHLDDTAVQFLHNSDNIDIIAPLVVEGLERARVTQRMSSTI